MYKPSSYCLDNNDDDDYDAYDDYNDYDKFMYVLVEALRFINLLICKLNSKKAIFACIRLARITIATNLYH